MYSSDICKDCRAFKALIAECCIESAFEIVDITENTQNLREFLHLRDTEAVFEAVRERGAIGIPCFVSNERKITLNEDVALAWIGKTPMEREDNFCVVCR
ncbi:MAG: glutaredoxin-related protein [Prevotella sp.]|nr:glutaredoxin-related protein [Prevotella sp.]